MITVESTAELFAPMPTELPNSKGHTFIDGDTLRNSEGNLLRIQGLDAPEILKLTTRGITPGTPGGSEAFKQIQTLAGQFGFHNVNYLTNDDGTPMLDATGKRQMVRLTDDSGRDFTETLAKYGITDLGKYSSPDEILAWQWGQAKKLDHVNNHFSNKKLNEFEKAKLAIDNAADAESWYKKEFQKVALNEKELARLTAPRQPGESILAYAMRQEEAKNYNKYTVMQDWQDRDINNKALHPWAEGFDVGWTGAIEGMYGMAEMIGEKTGFNWIEEIGEAGIARQRAYLADKPELKMNALKPVLDTEGNVIGNEWDINSIGEFFDYLGTNVAISIPYMGATMVGTALAPVTKGASLALPVSIYTGQTWNEMEGTNKSATLAVASGVTQTLLDRLGVKALMGTTRGTLLSNTYRDKLVKAVMQKNNVSASAARATINKLTRLESAKLLGNAATIAKEQLKARNLLKTLAKRGGIGFATEGATEVGQELTGYLAATYGSDKQFDAVELQNRLLNALIAGGTMGKAFAIPGVAYDAGAWADVAVRQAPADANRLSFAGSMANEEKRKTGKVQDIKEINTKSAQSANTRTGPTTKFSEKVSAGKTKQKQKDTFDKVKDMWGSIPVLWKGSTRFIFDEATQRGSQAIRELASMFGGNLQRIHSGEHFEEKKHNQLSKYRNMIQSPAEVAKAAGQGIINQKELSTVIQKFNKWVGKKKRLNWDNLPDELRQHEAWLAKWYSDTKVLADTLYQDQKNARENNGKKFEVGYLDNYLQRYKSFNKVAIEKDSNGFANALVAEYNMDLNTAKELTKEILDSGDVTDADSLFQVGRGRFIPAAHKKRRLGLAENTAFDKYMENDAFLNISNAAKSASRFITYQEFLGDNNEKINEKLNQALEQGVSQEKVNTIARQLQDYLDAESGNYKRIDNTTMSKIQKNLLFWTTMAGLPMAVISSFVELAITTRALTPAQISKTIMSAAKEFAGAAWSTIKDPRFGSTERQLAKEERQANIKRLGYFDWDVGAAQTTGATENSHASRRLLDNFFRIILLQQWTDYTRSIRASIASDFVMEKVNLIHEYRQESTMPLFEKDTIYTNEIQEAEEQLRNLGINVDRLIELNSVNQRAWTAEENKEFDDMMHQAQANFVNEAIALPGTYNRPLFYQNQHLSLFTQFQGFIATFTANHIPRMWGEYIKRGTPAMKYNMFAVMTTMIALGFASQYLKDLLKYGKPSPYLDDMEKLQRGIGSSGLLGVAERPINFFFPIYESSSKNSAEWLFNTISGEAASLSNVARIYGAAEKFVEGNAEAGAYRVFKTTPFIGPFNQLNRNLASGIFGD